MGKPVVLLAQPILAPLTGVLAQDYELVRLWEHPDLEAFLAGDGRRVEAICCAGEAPLGPELLGRLPRLGLVACISAGYDGIDVGWCAARGLPVTHSPGVNAEDVADHAVGAAIAAWRGIVEGDRRVREGRWTASDRGPMRPSLKGRQVGVVGLGGIGQAIASRMTAFGCPIAWWGPRPKPDAPWPMAASLLELAKNSDLLFVAPHAGPDTRGLIGEAVIEAVGPKGMIVNVSRGFVVDQAALIAALKDGRLGMAALDVFDPEPTDAALWAEVPNVVLTPHTAGATLDSVPAMVALMRENLRRHFAGEALSTPVKP